MPQRHPLEWRHPFKQCLHHHPERRDILHGFGFVIDDTLIGNTEQAILSIGSQSGVGQIP